MTIKEFAVGQTVYILDFEKRGEVSDRVRTAEIVKIGRKYVTISGAWETKFEASEDGPYLSEVKDCGSHQLLFPTQEAVDKYCEHEILRMWLRRAADWNRIDQYSLDQLCAVKKILEGENIEAS